MILQSSWNNSQFFSLLWNNRLSLISRLIWAEDITFIIRCVFDLLFFRALLNQCVFSIFIWFLRYMFWLRNCWIIIFCLLQFSAVTCISCIMTVNFLQLIFTAWFMIENQIRSCSSFFLIIIMLIMIKIFSLNSYLAVIILFMMKLFFILFMLSMTYDINQLWFRTVSSKQITINFLIKHIRTSCSYDDSDHTERLFCRAAV